MLPRTRNVGEMAFGSSSYNSYTSNIPHKCDIAYSRNIVNQHGTWLTCKMKTKTPDQVHAKKRIDGIGIDLNSYKFK
jgi:hypothetical protein